MGVSLVDTHAHLSGIEFVNDLDEVIANARALGVHRIVTVGTDLESSRKSIEIAERYEAVYAAVGIHPCYVTEAKDGDWDEIAQLIDHPKVVALGETGLDLYWDKTTLDLQRVFFRKHLELSRLSELPFIVHCRESEAEILEDLRESFSEGLLSGIMHSYCGSVEGAKEAMEMGMDVSFSGMVTFKKNDELRALAKTVPLDRILVETDAPYLSPMPHRGKRNEPGYTRHTAECLAEVFGESVERFSEMTTANAVRVFGKMDADLE